MIDTWEKMPDALSARRGLKYTELIADLVATVQLQHEEIENLKEKVESL